MKEYAKRWIVGMVVLGPLIGCFITYPQQTLIGLIIATCCAMAAFLVSVVFVVVGHWAGAFFGAWAKRRNDYSWW